jgi:glucan phosphoethanolaminetransferase (alkaline phosphatase superfamily)
MQRRHRLNYFYFGTLFVLLALLHIFHVLLVEQGSDANRAFYIIYAVGQCLFEVGALVLIGAWVAEKFPRYAKGLFIVGTLVLFLIHLIDFPLMRIMDMSIWYSMSFIYAESFDNFIEMLKASHIQLMTWMMMAVGLLVLALIGIFLFRVADRFSAKRPIYFSYGTAALFALAVIAALSFFDYRTSPIAAACEDGKFLKTLPWKTTLFPTAYPKLNLQASFPKKPDEGWYQSELGTIDIQTARRPNIYLFVAESIREDFITPETAPTLTQFRANEISFSCAVSGANATNKSWFSLFHSVYTFFWGDRQPKSWSKGSLPLQLFKKAGYKIHLLSASRLNFYQMNTIIFGKNQALADNYKIFADEKVLENHEYDAQCIDSLINTMQTAEEGHLFVIFFEGTHFDYSWPSSLQLPARPIAKAIDYLRITYSKEDLEGIKNRYRHAIYHIDEQFNRFLTALKSHPRQEEAVIVFTSDHGEEFFEEGRIFHASNLNCAQTRVPLYYRLPSKKALTTLTSHLDIFPTLLDHVLGEVPPWFDGESILRERQKPFTITARFNASRTPYEFLITTENELLLARFDNRTDIRNSRALEIISRKDQKETKLDSSLKEIQSRYRPILESLLSSQTEYPE